ncbi:MAG: hypothetical protein AAGC81_13885 [Pseudomonadota bacterium]
MLGLFNFFGRSERLKAFDQALLEFDVHPRLVPEAVKLTTIKLMQKGSDAEYVLRDADYERAAELLSYAILGPDQFAASNSPDAAQAAEQRLEEAIDAGDSLDAELILLALHSSIIHTTIAEQFDIETSE